MPLLILYVYSVRNNCHAPVGLTSGDNGRWIQMHVYFLLFNHSLGTQLNRARCSLFIFANACFFWYTYILVFVSSDSSKSRPLSLTLYVRLVSGLKLESVGRIVRRRVVVSATQRNVLVTVIISMAPLFRSWSAVTQRYGARTRVLHSLSLSLSLSQRASGWKDQFYQLQCLLHMFYSWARTVQQFNSGTRRYIQTHIRTNSRCIHNNYRIMNVYVSLSRLYIYLPVVDSSLWVASIYMLPLTLERSLPLLFMTSWTIWVI